MLLYTYVYMCECVCVCVHSLHINIYTGVTYQHSKIADNIDR